MLMNYTYAAFRQHWMNSPHAWYMRTFCITALGDLPLEQERFKRSDTGCSKLSYWARIRAAEHVTKIRVFYQNWRGLAKRNWWPRRTPKKPPPFSPIIVISELSLALADCDLPRRSAACSCPSGCPCDNKIAQCVYHFRSSPPSSGRCSRRSGGVS